MDNKSLESRLLGTRVVILLVCINIVFLIYQINGLWERRYAFDGGGDVLFRSELSASFDMSADVLVDDFGVTPLSKSKSASDAHEDKRSAGAMSGQGAHPKKRPPAPTNGDREQAPGTETTSRFPTVLDDDALAELAERMESRYAAGQSWTSDDIDDLAPPPMQWPVPRRSRTCVLTACSGKKYEQRGSLHGRTIGEHTWRNKQLYAAARGYDAVNVDLEYYKAHSRHQITGRHRMFVWAKIAVLRGCLIRYDYCFWVDADVVFTNLAFPVESFFRTFADENDGREPGMVIGETFELAPSNDMERLPAGPGTYRLNTGTIAMRSSEWSIDFVKRVWDMEGLDAKSQFDYIEGFNHEQSTMQRFMIQNPEDRHQTFFPPDQGINIHNSFSGPRDSWEPSYILVHYYGGFQGSCKSANWKEGNNQCIDEFIDRNMEVAATAPHELRDQFYPDWGTDREVAGRGEFDDLVEEDCVPFALSAFGITSEQNRAIISAVESWPQAAAFNRVPLAKRDDKTQWVQEIYIRLLRTLFWRYLLPIDYQDGRTRGSDPRLVALEQSFLPSVAASLLEQVGLKTKKKCLSLGNDGEKYVKNGGVLESLCSSVDTVDGRSACEGIDATLRSQKPGCVDADIATLDAGAYDFAISINHFDTYDEPWAAARRLHQIMRDGATVVWSAPSITHNTPGLSIHRWTVEGAKTMFEDAGFCVMSVRPLSNVAVTVAAAFGYSAEDFSHAEHKTVDPVAPLGVAVVLKKCVGSSPVPEGSGLVEQNAACCKFEGVESRKHIDCWRGLYGGRDKLGALRSCHDEEAAYAAWDGDAFYNLDFGPEGHKNIKGMVQASTTVVSAARERGFATGTDRPYCKAPLLRHIGANPRIQREMEEEMMRWPSLPDELLEPISSAHHSSGGTDGAIGGSVGPGGRAMQDLFLRMHRIMYWLNLAPFDLNMGWSRGTPLDRVFLNRVFFPYVRSKDITPGRCLEWGNTYMGGDLRSLCPHQYEIVEYTTACGGKHGQFDNSLDYTDVRPFHISRGGSDDTFKGGYCADIHRSQGIIPSQFFNVVICTFVFEHLHSPWLAAQNIFDMTAPGGYLVWAGPNNEVYHANPGDNWRYTLAGAKLLFERAGFCVIKVLPCSTSAVTWGFFFGFSDTDFSWKEMEHFEPHFPHTTAILAQRPVEDEGGICPPYEGIDLGKEYRCWAEGGRDSAGNECPRKDGGALGNYDWDGLGWADVSRADSATNGAVSVDVRPTRRVDLPGA